MSSCWACLSAMHILCALTEIHIKFARENREKEDNKDNIMIQNDVDDEQDEIVKDKNLFKYSCMN